jgi:uncharacterized membrane protein
MNRILESTPSRINTQNNKVIRTAFDLTYEKKVSFTLCTTVLFYQTLWKKVWITSMKQISEHRSCTKEDDKFDFNKGQNRILMWK